MRFGERIIDEHVQETLRNVTEWQKEPQGGIAWMRWNRWNINIYVKMHPIWRVSRVKSCIILVGTALISCLVFLYFVLTVYEATRLHATNYLATDRSCSTQNTPNHTLRSLSRSTQCPPHRPKNYPPKHHLHRIHHLLPHNRRHPHQHHPHPSQLTHYPTTHPHPRHRRTTSSSFVGSPPGPHATPGPQTPTSDLTSHPATQIFVTPPRPPWPPSSSPTATSSNKANGPSVSGTAGAHAPKWSNTAPTCHAGTPSE